MYENCKKEEKGGKAPFNDGTHLLQFHTWSVGFNEKKLNEIVYGIQMYRR